MAAELARTGRHVRISEDGLGARDAGSGNLSDDEAKPHEPIAKQNRHTIRTVEITQQHERTHLVSSITASQVQIDQMDAIIASQADIYYQLADNPPPNMSWHDLKALIHQGNSTKLSDAEVVYPLPVPPHVAGKGIPKSWPRPYLTRGELKLLSVPRLSMILAEYGLVTGGDRRLRRNRLAHYIGLGSL